MPIKSSKQIKQSNRSSKQTDQANKQIKRTSRSSKQADQANKENRKGKQFTLLLASRPDKKKSNEEAETNRASNTGPIKSNKENEAIEQIKQTNKIDKRQRFLLFRTTICSAWLSRFKEMPLQLLPKIAKMSRLVLSANRRPGIRPGPADGPGPS